MSAKKIYPDQKVKKDARGLRYVITTDGQPMYVSSCHNAAVTADGYGMCCKVCYNPVPDALGGIPVLKAGN